MKVLVCTIYDKVAKEAGPIFTAKNEDVAQRMLKQVYKDNSLFDDDGELISDDFDLKIVGKFDTEKAELESL